MKGGVRMVKVKLKGREKEIEFLHANVAGIHPTGAVLTLSQVKGNEEFQIAGFNWSAVDYYKVDKGLDLRSLGQSSGQTLPGLKGFQKPN